MQGEKTEHLSERNLTKAPTPASTPEQPDDGFSVEPSIANHPFVTVQDHSVLTVVGQGSEKS